MTAMVSVVGGGSVVQAQQLARAKDGKTVRISAVKGAHYVLTEANGGIAAGEIRVKRVGKNLVIEQEQAGAEAASVIIEDFYGSEGMLVGLGANGEYMEYLAATGDAAAAMSEGASSLLTLAAGQPAASFQFAEGGSSVFSSALTGVAAVAGGFALSNNGSSGGSKAQPVPVASAFVLDDQPADAPATQPTPAAVEPGVAAVQESDKTVAALTEVHDEAVAVGADASAIDGGIEEVDEIASNAGNTAAVESNPAPEAEAIGANGSVSAPAPIAPFGVDDIPVIEKMVDDKGTIQGVIADGGYTDDETPTIMGKAEPGVKVHVYRGKYVLGIAVTDANGEWSYTPPSGFNSGTHSFTVKYEYADKQTSGYSAPYVITIDKVPPPIPQIIGIWDEEGRITGAVTDQTITDDNRPTITGTAEAHATLFVYDKGKMIGSTTVDADGNWSFTPDTPLAEGLHMLSYSAVDRAGNSGDPTDVTEFFVDTRPEKVNIYYADDDAGSVTGEVHTGGVTDDSTPTLFGTATAGGIVKIYEGSTLLGEVVADVDGTWQFTLSALSEGAHSFHATVTLIAKGESDPSKLFKLEVDLAAPSAPTIEQVMDDVGLIQGLIEKGQATDDTMPTLSGKAEKGSTVRVFDNGILLGSAVADSNGGWTYTPSTPLAHGAHNFTIIAADAAGNTTASADQYPIRVDTVAPEAPSIVSVVDDVGPITGALQSGATTDDAEPTISGKAEANSTVIVRDHGVELGRVQANAEGEWTFTPDSGLSAGEHRITVVALDKAGNASVPSAPFDFDVSLVPPVAPSIVSIYDDVGLLKGLMSSGATTDDTTPLVAGKANPNSTVILKDNGVEIGRALADASGDWSFLPTTSLSLGLHNLVATSLDKTGNTGASSAIFGFRIVVPGGGGGLENFNTLKADPNSPYVTRVLPSGVVVSGEFSSWTPAGPPTGPGGPRPEDIQHGILAVHRGHDVQIDLPTESSKVSFFLLQAFGNSTVKYFDANGVQIGQTNISGMLNTGFRKCQFEAPAGKLIASMKTFTDGFDNSFIMDALQWGDRYPTGISISVAESDDFGGRIVYGSVSGIATLDPNMVIQVSTDGGKSWTNAVFSEGSWAAIQKDMPSGAWNAEVRMVERSSGLSLGINDSKLVEVRGDVAPKIERIADAEGMYTAAKAADGSLIELSLKDTGAKQGDKVHIRWGTVTYDHTLTKAEIDAGHAIVRMPSEQILLQGVKNDFSVNVQIIGANGTIGVLSAPHHVVGSYVVAAATADNLQKNPENNAYQGAGFKVSTDGVMTNTAASASTHSGLTLSAASQANATFTLEKPAREITLRFSGIDSELGVKIQLFDTNGTFIEESVIYGDATAFRANAFKYSAKDERVDIGSFKIIGSEKDFTLDMFTKKDVIHTRETRDMSVVDSNTESFYGTDGDDVVRLTMSPESYFTGVTAGIHGGQGIDTLRVEATAEPWMRSAKNITSMEIVDFVKSIKGQFLALNLSDVLLNGGTNAFYAGDQSRVQMMVKGGSTLSFELEDNLIGGGDVGRVGGDLGDWVQKASVTINGTTYNTYRHSSLAAEVLVESGVVVTLKNRAEFFETGVKSLGVDLLLEPMNLHQESMLLQDVKVDLLAAESTLPSSFHSLSPAAGSIDSAALGLGTQVLDQDQLAYLAY